jgi:hypothetical protein
MACSRVGRIEKPAGMLQNDVFQLAHGMRISYRQIIVNHGTRIVIEETR